MRHELANFGYTLPVNVRYSTHVDAPDGLPWGSLEDKELTLAFQRGDEGAYQAIYERYSPRVQGICRRMLGDPDDAQEATQETFLRVYQGLARFNGRYQLAAWVTRIATNVCLDQIRSRSRRPADPAPAEVLDVHGEVPRESSDPEILFIRHAEGRRVRRILDSLPPLHRAAIVLRDFEGLTYEEIASALQLSDLQVKALLHRARKGFRKWWMSALPAFLPARLINRLREFSGTAREQAAQALTPATDAINVASQGAGACSGILHQCTHYFGQHMVPIVTATLVGTAVATSVPLDRAISPPVVAEVFDPGVASQESETKGRSDGKAGEPVDADDAGEPDAVVVATPTPTPTATSTPTPTPTPEESPAPTPSASPSPSPSASSKPSGQGVSEGEEQSQFAPSVGFDRGEAIPSSAPSSHEMSLSCDYLSVTQTLRTRIYDGDKSYPVLLRLRASGASGALEAVVSKDGQEVTYRSWGDEPKATWSEEGDSLRLSLTGSYGPTHGSNPEAVGLPGGGGFSADLTFNCSTTEVTTQRVILGT